MHFDPILTQDLSSRTLSFGKAIRCLSTGKIQLLLARGKLRIKNAFRVRPWEWNFVCCSHFLEVGFDVLLKLCLLALSKHMLPQIVLTGESGRQDLENLYPKRGDCPIQQQLRLLEL